MTGVPSYDELHDGLLARIPVYAPEWTDHSDSDPGVTLLELFASLADDLLHRQNEIAGEAHLDAAGRRRRLPPVRVTCLVTTVAAAVLLAVVAARRRRAARVGMSAPLGTLEPSLPPIDEPRRWRSHGDQ